MDEFFIPGDVEGHRRPRATARGGFVRIYDDPANLLWAERVRLAWWQAGCSQVGTGPLYVRFWAYVPRPKSHYRKDGATLSALGQRTPIPTRKPDLDNVAKGILDALNGIAWRDDAQFARLLIDRIWSDSFNAPGLKVSYCAMAVGEGSFS